MYGRCGSRFNYRPPILESVMISAESDANTSSHVERTRNGGFYTAGDSL